MSSRCLTSGAFLVSSGFENEGPFDLTVMVTSFSRRQREACVEVLALTPCGEEKEVGETTLLISPHGFNTFTVNNLADGFYVINIKLSSDDLHPSAALVDDEGDVVFTLSPADFVPVDI